MPKKQGPPPPPGTLRHPGLDAGGTGQPSAGPRNVTPKYHGPPEVRWSSPPATGGAGAPIQAKHAPHAGGGSKPAAAKGRHEPPAIHWNVPAAAPQGHAGRPIQPKLAAQQSAGAPGRHHAPPAVHWNRPPAATSAPVRPTAQAKIGGTQRPPASQGRHTVVQRMFRSDFERKVNPKDKFIQLPYDRENDMTTHVKHSVDAYGDGSGAGVYKHFIPNNWLHKIFEACLSGATLEVVPSIANSLTGQTLPPRGYIPRGHINLPIADTEEFGDGEALFRASIYQSLYKFVDNPYNIFRGDSDGDGGGTKIDIPISPSPALQNRLSEFAMNLVQQADRFLSESDLIIVGSDDWDAIKVKIQAAVEELNSR